MLYNAFSVQNKINPYPNIHTLNDRKEASNYQFISWDMMINQL